MPLPTPKGGESKNTFVSRCVRAIQGEFEDNKQRVAVCFSQWKKKGKKTGKGAMPSKIHIRKRGSSRMIAFDPTRSSKIAKLDADRQIVFGWANVCVECSGTQVVDSHNEMIDPDELENGAYNFVLNFGGMGEDHEGTTKGKLIESFFVSPDKLSAMGLAKDALPLGWWIGFYVEDQQAWEKVKTGKHRMFSIQGIARRKEV